MIALNRTAPFLGKGWAWPIRINPVTGGIQMSEGTFETAPVSLAFTPDAVTAAERVAVGSNKLREAVGHILSTEIGEYDFLPEFGSRPSTIIHDPNNQYSRMEYETWVELAIARWEKRVRLKVPQDFRWDDNEDESDLGIARCSIDPNILPTQVQGNLVAPFVDSRGCRKQEFPLGEADSEGHDWTSRYHGKAAYQVGSERYLRSRTVLPFDHQPDDNYYTVTHGDTWLTISYKTYGDVRFWWVIADYYTHDAADAGMSRRALKVSEELTVGTLLRYPSRARILTQMAA